MATVTGKKFYVYDMGAAEWIGETGFAFSHIDALASNMIATLQTQIFQASSGQSVRYNDTLREELFVFFDTRRQTVVPVISSITYSNVNYPYSAALNNTALPDNMFDTKNLGDVTSNRHYRFCIDDEDYTKNYFDYWAASAGFELYSININGVNHTISSSVGQALGNIISIFTNINYPTMGVVALSSDDRIVGAKISAAENTNINCQYGALDSTNSGYYLTLYNMAESESYTTDFEITCNLDNCTADPGNPSTIPPAAVITTLHFTPDVAATFDSGSVSISGTGVTPDDSVLFTWNYETGELRVGAVTSDITISVTAFIDPYADLDVDGETDIPDADTISMPTLPPLNAVTSGVIGLFNPTPAQMKLLADYMWTDFGGTGTTEVDVLKEIVQAIKRTISNPLDYIFGLNIIPSQGLDVSGDLVEIRFGFTNSGVSMPRLLRQYFTVNCGTLSFDTLCGDTFLDYAPYAKFSIYLPYIGIKEVDANDFVGHTIGVIYRGDVVTGGVTAFITKDGSVMYQYSGSCALTIPLSSSSWGATLSGAVQIATAIAGGAVSGGAAGAVEGALSGAANVAANPSQLSPTIARSGAVSGAAGVMAVQTPYIIREAVRFHDTAFFNTVTGYPSYYYRQLGSLHGYTKVYDIHLHDVAATSEEITEIENLLQEGVIL